ncbi:unnamed protein product [Pleuronectes platessa]|uniref:Uncharacterized protein n=1 Tax=Pleuronectes platessa TaxID=8262 RepID=A0A9N7UQW4_PLEPL|nr:unnamed protein product [Pleuronectes platessa]
MHAPFTKRQRHPPAPERGKLRSQDLTRTLMTILAQKATKRSTGDSLTAERAPPRRRDVLSIRPTAPDTQGPGGQEETRSDKRNTWTPRATRRLRILEAVRNADAAHHSTRDPRLLSPA